MIYGQPPVSIEPHNPLWAEQFETERRLLLPDLAPWLVGLLEHIGSTAGPACPPNR